MSVLLDYQPSHFTSLPYIDEAATAVETFGGLDQVIDALAVVVKRHACAANYALYLLHRHSSLDDDEVMLAYGNVTMPIKTSALSDSARGLVYATIWGIRPGTDEFGPLEFAFAQDETTGQSRGLDAGLAKDIAAVLKQFNVDTMLGLGLAPSPGPNQVIGLESTHGRANIVQPMHMFRSGVESVEVLWRLVNDDEEANALGETSRRCLQFCQLSAGGTRNHSRGHYEQK